MDDTRHFPQPDATLHCQCDFRNHVTCVWCYDCGTENLVAAPVGKNLHETTFIALGNRSIYVRIFPPVAVVFDTEFFRIDEQFAD